MAASCEEHRCRQQCVFGTWYGRTGFSSLCYSERREKATQAASQLAGDNTEIINLFRSQVSWVCHTADEFPEDWKHIRNNFRLVWARCENRGEYVQNARMKIVTND